MTTQSNPGFVTGQQPSAAQWNGYFAAKLDAVNAGTMAGQNANAISVTGGAIDGTVIGGTTPTTMNGIVTATGSTTGRSLAARFADVVNVLDYGADPTGASDSSTAIQAAINKASLLGSTVFIPAGSYKLLSGLTVSTSGVCIIGVGRRATTLTFANTGDGIHVNATTQVVNGSISHLSIVGPGATSTGSAIHVGNVGAHVVRDVIISGFYDGITYDNGGVANRCEVVDISNYLNDGFVTTGTGNNIYYRNCTTFNPTNTPGHAGFGFYQSNGGPWMSGCVTQAASYGLLVQPANGASVYDLFVENCDFDSSQIIGVLIDSSSGGTIHSGKFTNVRGSYSITHGLKVMGSNSVALSFVNGEFSKNEQNGVLITGGSGIGFVGTAVNGNSSTSAGSYAGYEITGGTDISIIGGFTGSYPFTSASQQPGIAIASSFTGNLTVSGCDVTGNQGVGPVAAINNLSTSTGVRIRNCRGYNPVGLALPLVGASPWTYQALGDDQVVTITGGTTTNIKVSDLSGNAYNLPASAGYDTVTLPAGCSLTLTYSAGAPDVQVMHV